MGKSILELLESLNISPDSTDVASVKKALAAVAKKEAEEKAALLAEKKKGSKEALIDFLQDARRFLSEGIGEMLPGSHATFRVRVKEDGSVVATANDCHAKGWQEGIHVDAFGAVTFGAEGKEQAKNVRNKRKGQ